MTLFMATIVSLNAQVGIGTTTPAASSILDVTSTTRGVLIPRMTDAQRTAIAAPAEGLMIYQTNASAGLWMFINGAWERIGAATGATSFGASTGYAANTVGSVLAIVLTGVDVPLPSAQNLGSITVNGANTVFTVPTAGRYRIAYRVNATATVGLGAASAIVVNGATRPAQLRFAPLLSVSSYQAEGIITLAAGDNIRLELSGIIALTTLLTGSQGAYLVIQKVGE